MSKHSPGPWRWEEWPENRTSRLVCDNGDSVLRIHDDDHSRFPDPPDKALIAAAPEMLALLRKVTNACASLIHDRYDGTSALDSELARCGIAEAEALLKRMGE